jgi:hypothetical protein
VSRLDLVRDLYRAFSDGDRDFFERHLADGFSFSSPLDVGLDRAGFFERCWPGAGGGEHVEYVRLIEAGEEVVVTYERVKADGVRGRNTEVLTFDGDRIAKVEVYFGW